MAEFFLTVLIIYVAVIYAGAQVSPTTAGSNTRVPVGQYAQVTFPEGWEIVPVGYQRLAVAR